jgi:hypothetical protein
MQNKLHTNKAKIDSFSLLIPIENITITLHSFFTQKFIKVYTTGEPEESESFYKNIQKVQCTTTATLTKYQKVHRIYNDTNRKFIHIVITSKHLGKAYFEGINSNNIETIFEHINSQNIIHVPCIDTFLSSYVVDIDIAKDFKTNINEFKALKNILIENVLPLKQKYLHSKNINSTGAKFGIQYNERSKATPTTPFGKLYNKTNELLSNSEKFYETNLLHISDEIAQGIARIEFTIKASAHKKRLGIKFTTLKELLNFSQDELNNIYTKLINEYYFKVETMKKAKATEGAKDTLIYYLMQDAFKSNTHLTIEHLLFKMLQNETCRMKKSRMKKVLLETYEKLNKKENLSSRTEGQKVVIDILKNIGIYEG